MNAAQDTRHMAERLEASAKVCEDRARYLRDEVGTEQGTQAKAAVGTLNGTAHMLRQIAEGLSDMWVDLEQAASIARDLAQHPDTVFPEDARTISKLVGEKEAPLPPPEPNHTYDECVGAGWCDEPMTEHQAYRTFGHDAFDPGGMPLLGSTFEADGSTWRAVAEHVNNRTLKRVVVAERINGAEEACGTGPWPEARVPSDQPRSADRGPEAPADAGC